MGKIFKFEELKNNQYALYSESYEVRFWLQEDVFWVQKSEIYYAKTKSESQYVINRWKSDYKKQKVQYITTTYQ